MNNLVVIGVIAGIMLAVGFIKGLSVTIVALIGIGLAIMILFWGNALNELAAVMGRR